jgi:hypothetical protein
MILLSSLLLLVAGATVVACVTAIASILPVAGILAVADVLLVPDGLLLLVFEVAVACGPAVTGFLLLMAFLLVASIPADPGVPILAGGFTCWTVIFSAVGLANSINYRTIGYRI